ncbi:MAG: hypothetical protein IKH24_08480 [Bacteroidales bacterium]|nr:hypothetical protein [Bacteroidales bacterium]
MALYAFPAYSKQVWGIVICFKVFQNLYPDKRIAPHFFSFFIAATEHRAFFTKSSAKEVWVSGTSNGNR